MTVTEQLPAFIFYLVAGCVLLGIVGVFEALLERSNRKQETYERRREIRAQAWREIEELA